MMVSSPFCRLPDEWAKDLRPSRPCWAVRPARGAAVGPAHLVTLLWGRRASPSPGSAKVPATCDPTKGFLVTLETGSGNPRSQNALLNKDGFDPSSSA